MNNDLTEKVVQHVLCCKEEELRKLNVQSIARHFNVNRSHLARVFRAQNGCKLCDYIHKEKMSRAAAILANRPELTIKELAQLMGFASPEYFSRLFKDFHHTAPNKYRKYKSNNNNNN
jgi:AraC-like DNA-binding protein